MTQHSVEPFLSWLTITELCGWFDKINGEKKHNIVRLKQDGTVDLSFNPDVNAEVLSISLQPDGKILIGGYFDKVNGEARHNMARLNTDGTLDGSFVYNSSLTNEKHSQCFTER